MHSNFLSEINHFLNLRKSDPYINDIYTQLFSIYKNNNSDIDIDSIFASFKSIINDYDILKSNYFDDYFERLKYEIIMDVYSSINFFVKERRNEKETVKESIVSYMTSSNLCIPANELSYGQTISKLKSQLTHNSSLSIAPRSTSRKYSVFYSDIVEPFIDKNFLPMSLLPSKDTIFNLLNYSHLIFRDNHWANGLQICEYLDLISNHSIYQDESNLFTKEYSTYLFEYFHYPIQYLNCFSSYLNEDFCDKKYSGNQWLLFLYTKLFDTHYISLSDYLYDKYHEKISHLWVKSNKNIEKEFFFELQKLNTYLIPMLSLTIEYFLYDIYLGKCDRILSKLSNYISDKLCASKLNHHVSYSQMLINTSLKLNEIKYPSNKPVVVPTKTDSPDYRFNNSISKCFFTKQLSNYLYDYIFPYKFYGNTNDDNVFYQFITNAYSTNKSLENSKIINK